MLHVGAKWIAMREHEPRHPIGQRRLADPGRSPDQPGMRNAAAAIGVQQSELGIAMSEQRNRLARVNRRYLVFDMARAHAEVARLPVLAAKKRSRKAAHMLAATIPGSGVASINTQRCGSPAAIFQYASRSC